MFNHENNMVHNPLLIPIFARGQSDDDEVMLNILRCQLTY